MIYIYSEIHSTLINLESNTYFSSYICNNKGRLTVYLKDGYVCINYPTKEESDLVLKYIKNQLASNLNHSNMNTIINIDDYNK